MFSFLAKFIIMSAANFSLSRMSHCFVLAELLIEELSHDSVQYKAIKNDILGTIFHNNKLSLFKVGDIHEVFSPDVQKKVCDISSVSFVVDWT